MCAVQLNRTHAESVCTKRGVDITNVRRADSLFSFDQRLCFVHHIFAVNKSVDVGVNLCECMSH